MVVSGEWSVVSGEWNYSSESDFPEILGKLYLRSIHHSPLTTHQLT